MCLVQCFGYIVSFGVEQCNDFCFELVIVDYQLFSMVIGIVDWDVQGFENMVGGGFFIVDIFGDFYFQGWFW